MTENTTEIYLGSRGNDFKQLIIGLLERGRLKPKYIELLTNESNMTEYGIAFTGATANTVDNYERYEQIGDLSANKFIVSYVYDRFPQIDCTQGVKIAARLRIVFGSKQTFAPLGERLGFWPYISAQMAGSEKNQKYRSRDKKALIEDAFEAFIGCTEYLLDKNYRRGVGYAIVYDILASIFDELPMSLKFEDLYDAKTRLKETFDKFKQLGKWEYIYGRENIGDEGYTQAIATVYQIPPGINHRPAEITDPVTGETVKRPRQGWIPIGLGKSSNQDDAEQKAAVQGIETLKMKGVYRKPPEIYTHFCQ